MSSGMIPYAMVKWVWIVFIVFWVLAAFVQNATHDARLWARGLMQFSIIFSGAAPFFVESGRAGFLYRTPDPNLPASSTLAFCCCCSVFGFAVWARFVLGRNWSGISRERRTTH